MWARCNTCHYVTDMETCLFKIMQTTITWRMLKNKKFCRSSRKHTHKHTNTHTNTHTLSHTLSLPLSLSLYLSLSQLTLFLPSLCLSLRDRLRMMNIEAWDGSIKCVCTLQCKFGRVKCSEIWKLYSPSLKSTMNIFLLKWIFTGSILT